MNEIQNVINELVQLRASFLEAESQHDIYFRLYGEYQKKVIELQRAFSYSERSGASCIKLSITFLITIL
jgi:adenylate cyclase class IV